MGTKAQIFVRSLLGLCASAQGYASINVDSIQKCVSQKYQALTDRRGIVAAVVDAKDTKLMTFGQAKIDQIFEIGSVTKTFTGNLLAQEVVSRHLDIFYPIPKEYQKGEAVITYYHLTTHTSGIIPGNFPDYVGPNPQSPYEGLNIPLFKKLYAKTPLMSGAIPGDQWAYSNIATGLLGTILAENNRTSYESLVIEKIFKKLNMADSYFEVPEKEKHRFPKGNVNGTPFSHWDLFNTAINPAGGIRSTIGDMAKYARANLIPRASSIEAAIKLSQKQLYHVEGRNFWMGMNWIIEPDKQLIWHNGSTVAFNSILELSAKHNLAVVAMTDTGVFKEGENGDPIVDKSLQEIAFSCLN